MTYRIISADSHFVEPPDMWGERMDKKFRDRAPHTVRGNDGKEGEFFVCENITPVPVAGFFGSGKSAEELPEHTKKGFEVAPKSVWDPAERLKEQDRDGVTAEALYTSMGMLLFGRFRVLLEHVGESPAAHRPGRDYPGGHPGRGTGTQAYCSGRTPWSPDLGCAAR